MSFEFPFRYAEVQGIGQLFYPVVKVQLLTLTGWKDYDFLVDTGADITTLPTHLLPALGIKRSQLPSHKTLGVGSIEIIAWEFRLPIKIGTSTLTIQASAVQAPQNSMPPLLGRKDIFESRFNLEINSKLKKTIITEN